MLPYGATVLLFSWAELRDLFHALPIGRTIPALPSGLAQLGGLWISPLSRPVWIFVRPASPVASALACQ
jgi:hypothetical protein